MVDRVDRSPREDPGASDDGGVRGLARFESPSFDPFPGLRGGHRQTVAGRLARARLRATYARERIETPDGDFLDLDVWNAGVARRPLAVCLVLHGLEGSARSGYVVSACHALVAHGMLPVALNFRSCSGEMNRTPGSYHAGRTDDVGHALDWIAARGDETPLLLLGFSLGGNVLVKLLAERADGSGRGDAAGHAPAASHPRPSSRLAGAVAVSVPYDLAACAQRLERGAGRLYGLHFLRSLRAKARAKALRFPDSVDFERVERARTVREFDDGFTAPVHGFVDAADYYGACSGGRFIDGIRVPTLLVQAADDPLVPSSSVPCDAVRRNPAVRLAFTERGGHVGFVAAGPARRPHGWVEREAARFLAACVANGSSASPPHGRTPGTLRGKSRAESRGDDLSIPMQEEPA